MSTHTSSSRPWYCNDRLVDAYKNRAFEGDDLRVLKTVRAIESLIVNLGIIVVTLVATHYGEANWYVILTSIVTLGLLNGVFAADYKALARALAELPSDSADSSDRDG